MKHCWQPKLWIYLCKVPSFCQSGPISASSFCPIRYSHFFCCYQPWLVDWSIVIFFVCDSFYIYLGRVVVPLRLNGHDWTWGSSSVLLPRGRQLVSNRQRRSSSCLLVSSPMFTGNCLSYEPWADNTTSIAVVASVLTIAWLSVDYIVPSYLRNLSTILNQSHWVWVSSDFFFFSFCLKSSPSLHYCLI